MPSQDDLEALGTIRVDIYRVVWRGIIENPFHKGGLGQLDGDHAVHEKAKKAGSEVPLAEKTLIEHLVHSTEGGGNLDITESRMQDKLLLQILTSFATS